MDEELRLDQLIMASYNQGFHCGEGNAGNKEHTQAGNESNALRDLFLAYMELQQATIDVLKAEIAIVKNDE